MDGEAAGRAVRPSVALTTEFTTTDQIQVFTAEYRFPKASIGEHFTLQVRMARAPRLLSPASYEERKTRFARSGANLAQEFPQIGRRAQRELSVGPGGSAYGVTFTTDDGEWDISVMVSSLLPQDVEAPDVDVDSFARLIESRYENQRQRNLGVPPPAVP